MKNSSLSNKALLVSINISQWTGRKLDKKATDSTNKAYKAKSNAGRYNKKLLPNAKELDLVQSVVGQTRQYFYKQTLPWMSDGSRILNSKNYMNFTTEIRKFTSDFQSSVDSFLANYPLLKQNAKNSLGDLYDESEYPTVEEMRNKFKIEINFLPLPNVSDFRIDISEAEKKMFINKMKEIENRAVKEVWSRLHTVVSSAISKLEETDPIFRNSLIGNIEEMISMLPRLNISEDQELDLKAQELKNILSKYSIESLRNSKSKRELAAKELKEIESKMSSFMGEIK